MTADGVRRVLLVARDADALAALGSTLRNRGFSVVLANSVSMACSRAAAQQVDIIVVDEHLALGSDGLITALELDSGGGPPYLLLVDDPEAAWGDNNVLPTDVDTIVTRALQLTVSVGPPASQEPSPQSTLMGHLGEVSLLALTESIWNGKRSGTLTVATSGGAGELRFSRGELVDAVYLRFEGVKALVRVLGQKDGTFVFTAGTPIVMRRVTTPTADLLRDARAALEASTGYHQILGDLSDLALVAIEGPPAGATLSPLSRSILSRLRTPATLEELLDGSPDADADILRALVHLDAAGRLRRMDARERRFPLVAADQHDRIQALTAQAQRAGFSGSLRIVFAGAPARLALLEHTVLRLEEAAPASLPPPTVPAPHEMATLRASGGAAVALIALPLVPAYSPLWAMTLAGAQAVVRLDTAAAEMLADACAVHDLVPVDAQMLVGVLDEGDAEQVGNLVRAALTVG
jgi:hypothetical protein